MRIARIMILFMVILLSFYVVVAIEYIKEQPSQSQPLSETGTQSEGPPDYEVVKEGEGPIKGPINRVGEENLIPDDSEGDVQYEKPKEEPKQPEPVITPGPGEYSRDGGILAQPDTLVQPEIPELTEAALPEFNTVGLLLAGILGAGAWLWMRKKRL